MTGTWPTGWATNDIVSAAEYAKGIGAIYDTTLGAGAASIDVTSIVGSYAHLLIMGYLRSDTAAQGVDLIVRFNADSGANYGYQTVTGNDTGGVVTKLGSITATSINTGGQLVIAAASATASAFSFCRIMVPHYAGTANFKAAELVAGNAGATTVANNYLSTGVGLWRSASAINRVTISASAATSSPGAA